jgi:hypothetical protein
MDTAFDLEAEQAVLGTFLIDDTTWARIGDSFCPEPFYLQAHQAIAVAPIARHAKAEPADPILLRGDLADADRLPGAGDRDLPRAVDGPGRRGAAAGDPVPDQSGTDVRGARAGRHLRRSSDHGEGGSHVRCVFDAKGSPQ